MKRTMLIVRFIIYCNNSDGLDEFSWKTVMPTVSRCIVTNFECGRYQKVDILRTLPILFFKKEHTISDMGQFLAQLIPLGLAYAQDLPRGMYALPDDWEKIDKNLADGMAPKKERGITCLLGNKGNITVDSYRLDGHFCTVRGHACTVCAQFERMKSQGYKETRGFIRTIRSSNPITIYKIDEDIFPRFPAQARRLATEIEKNNSALPILFMHYSCAPDWKNECALGDGSFPCVPYTITSAGA